MIKMSSKILDMENELEILGQIKRVDAPKHLYERISKSIELQKKEVVSTKFTWMAAACLILIFALNLLSIQINKNNTEPNLIEIFSLNTQNIVYYEKE